MKFIVKMLLRTERQRCICSACPYCPFFATVSIVETTGFSSFLCCPYFPSTVHFTIPGRPRLAPKLLLICGARLPPQCADRIGQNMRHLSVLCLPRHLNDVEDFTGLVGQRLWHDPQTDIWQDIVGDGTVKLADFCENSASPNEGLRMTSRRVTQLSGVGLHVRISFSGRQKDQVSYSFGVPGGEPLLFKVLLLGDLSYSHQGP